MRHTVGKILGVTLLVMLTVSCSGPAEKKAKFLAKGKHYLEKGDYTRAGLELRNAVQIDPKYADAYYLLGKVALKKEDFKGAFGAFNKAVELDPRQFKAHYELGKILLGAGAPDKALEKAELILKETPDDEDALLLKGAVFVARKEHEKARDYLKGLLGRKITRPDAYMLLATTYMQTGDAKTAENFLREGAAANAGSVELQLALADLCAKNKRFDDAAGFMRKAIELRPDDLKLRIGLAGFYWDTGKPDKAQEAIREFVGRDRNNEDSWIVAGSSYASRGKFDEAEKELKEGISVNGKSFKIRFALAGLYRNANMNDRTVAILNECLGLAKDPAKPEIIQTKNMLAEVHLQRKEIDEANRYVNEVIKESPKSLEAHFTRGLILLQKGDGVNAVSEFRTVVSEHPTFIQGYVKLAEAHVRNREMNLALDSLQNAQKIDPSSREVQLALSRFYGEQKDFGQSEAILRKLLQKNPNDVEVMASMGALFARMRNYAKAEAEYAAIKSRAPQMPLGYVMASQLYLGQGRTDRALAELELGVKKVPSSGEMLDLLTQLSIKQKNYGMAVAACESHARLYPRDAVAYSLLGNVYNAQNERQKALASYEKALALDPQSWPTANNLAFLLSETATSGAELDRAFALARKAQAGRPDDGTILDTLGWIYYKKGDTKQAIDHFNRIYDKYSNDPVLNYHLGMALYKDGKSEQAKACLKKATAAPGEYLGKDVARTTLAKMS